MHYYPPRTWRVYCAGLFIQYASTEEIRELLGSLQLTIDADYRTADIL